VMRALVTGSAGFVGRHIVAELERRGYDVSPCDIAYRQGARRQREYVKDANRIFKPSSDLKLSKVVFDLVVHCAFHVGGRAAIDGVNTNFAKNLQLDAAMFEWAVRTKQKRVLYFSSSAAYPKWRQVKTGYPEYDDPIVFDPLKEDDIRLKWPEEPDANYGWAKLTGERLAEDARKNGLAVTVVRPFSGYGEDQSDDYPFPSIVKRASQGDLSVWGPAGQTRDWIHIDDVVKGALSVVESGTSDPVNLCTGRGVEMGELMRKAYSLYPGMKTNTSPNVQYDESKPTGVFYRVGDPTRFNEYYTPTVTLEEGIRRAFSSQERQDWLWGWQRPQID
jgi:nucleoside-diphosphate-sugar epimerase